MIYRGSSNAAKEDGETLVGAERSQAGRRYALNKADDLREIEVVHWSFESSASLNDRQCFVTSLVRGEANGWPILPMPFLVGPTGGGVSDLLVDETT